MTTGTPRCSPGHAGFVAAIAGILAAATGVRLLGLTREAFWVDEVISFNLTTEPGLAVLPAIAQQIHPPVFFLGLALWRSVFGSTEFAVRSFSVAAGVLAVIATMLLAHAVASNRTTTVWAGALAAVSPVAVYFSQEARMYALTSALVALSTWVLLVWVRRSSTGRSTIAWALGYIVLVEVLLLTHHIGIVVALAQGLAVGVVFLIHRSFRLLLGYLTAAAAVAVLFLPWLRFVQSVRSGLYRATDLAWLPSPGASDVFLMFTRDLVWGSPGWEAVGWWIGQTAAIALTAVTLWVLWSRHFRVELGNDRTPGRFGLAFTLWMVVGPVALVLLISWVYHPVFWYPRFCTLVLPPAVVLAASAITAARGRFLAPALPVALVSVAVVGLVAQYLAINKGGMREFARFWHHQGPPDVVYFYPEWKRTVARYELGQNLPHSHRKRLERRLNNGVTFTLWVCSVSHYDSIWRPDWERRERERVLSLGPRRTIGVVDRMDVVEVEVPATR
jgi:uncharacterized membrane protein